MKFLITGGSGFIGTNLTQHLADKGFEFINVDIVPPKLSRLNNQWTNCNILDIDTLIQTFHKFQPNVVVHLAAETDTDPKKTIDDYRVNTEGTRNVIKAIQSVDSVKRAIFTSTQFVHQGKTPPTHDQDYFPHTIYGESKIINEQDVRVANLNTTWTIIRPTNIWGPWHLRYPFEFWSILSRNLYIHPGGQAVIRSYGYVGTVVWQVMNIVNSSSEMVNGKVFYVGDAPIELYDWVNGFSIHQTGKSVRVVPRNLIRLIALAGDLLRVMGIRFPITSSRFKSMTESNPAPMSLTLNTFGHSPYTLEMGIIETVNWMKQYHPNLVTRK